MASWETFTLKGELKRGQGRIELQGTCHFSNLSLLSFAARPAFQSCGQDSVLFRVLGPQLAPASAVLVPKQHIFVYLYFYVLHLLVQKCSTVALERSTSTLDLRSFSCWRDPPSRMRLASSPFSQVCWCLSGVLKVYTTLYNMAYLVFVFSKLEIFKLPILLWDDIWLEVLYMAWDWRCRS